MSGRSPHLREPSVWLPVFLIVVAGLLPSPPTPVEASGVQHVARFERTACPFEAPRWTAGRPAECGNLIVPEVRSQPNGRTLRLAVAIYRAVEKSDDPPLLLLHGGPGGAGGIRTPLGSVFFQSPVGRTRDLVFYDLRGAGLSEPHLCPTFYAGTEPVFNRPTPIERDRGYLDAVRACVAELDAKGVDRTAYSTAVNVADAIDLRHALGYPLWDVFSVSYGALVAQGLMQQDPHGTHAAILLAPATPGPKAAENALTFQRTLKRVFAACAGQAECRSAFPTLAEDFDQLVAAFSKDPLKLEIGDGSIRINHAVARRRALPA